MVNEESFTSAFSVAIISVKSHAADHYENFKEKSSQINLVNCEKNIFFRNVRWYTPCKVTHIVIPILKSILVYDIFT